MIHSNRAFARLRMEAFADCADDCDEALRLNPKNLKALSRRAEARVKLGKLAAAQRDIDALKEHGYDLQHLEQQIQAKQAAVAPKPAPKPTPKPASPAAPPPKPESPKAPKPAREAAPAVAPAPVEATKAGVEGGKQQGNSCFQQGDYLQAIAWFSGSLQHRNLVDAETQTALFSNRALAYNKLERWAEAEADCTDALKTASAAAACKAHYRRGLARCELGELTGALQDVNAVLGAPQYADKGHPECEKLKARVLQLISEKKAALRREKVSGAAMPRTNVRVPTSAPRTAFEIGKNFHGLKRYPEQLAEYVKTQVSPQALRQCFGKTAIEAELLEQLVAVLAKPGLLEPQAVRGYLDALLQAECGETNLAMLSDGEREALRVATRGAAPAPTDARLRKLKLLE